MPACFIFHERYILALYGFHNNRGRLALCCLCLVYGIEQCIEIMCVRADYIPAESLEFFINRSRIHYVLYVSVNLQAVIINKNREIIKLIMSRKHCLLPDLTFLQLTVTEYGINSVVLFVKLCRKCHTACRTYSLAQRTC